MEAMTNFQKEDLKYIKDPKLWPRWPIMPMKKYSRSRLLEVASIVAVRGFLTTLVFDEGQLLWEPPQGCATWKDVLDKFPDRKVYESAEAMIADGWQCD